jgi:NADPH-dependent 2,4-dienoyl-CoA reductase/sulfur reductase-like enzyme
VRRVLIVGASVAGVRTAQALRRGGFDGAITLVGQEPHHPYDRPPLSKEMLASDGGGAPVPLLAAEEPGMLGLDLRLGLRATGLAPGAAVVSTASGEDFSYSGGGLVIATGLVPRTLPFASPLGVYTIRTVDDARAVRAALAARPRVVVVGAGFIGAELASAAREYGCEVTVVEAQPVPMAQLVGPEVGGLLAGLHAVNGTELVAGVGVAAFESAAGAVTGVVLGDGRVLAAGLVIVGIGARPATDWLGSSGLPADDGIRCDEHLRVVGFPQVHAAGDVARWPHPRYGELRIEHWTNANEHGAVVAADILGLPLPAAQVPYVWSDQYGHRIQIAGRSAAGRLAVLRGTAVGGDLVALYAGDDGGLVGGVVVDDTRTFMKVRRAVASAAPAGSVELPLPGPARS